MNFSPLGSAKLDPPPSSDISAEAEQGRESSVCAASRVEMFAAIACLLLVSHLSTTQAALAKRVEEDIFQISYEEALGKSVGDKRRISMDVVGLKPSNIWDEWQECIHFCSRSW